MTSMLHCCCISNSKMYHILHCLRYKAVHISSFLQTLQKLPAETAKMHHSAVHSASMRFLKQIYWFHYLLVLQDFFGKWGSEGILDLKDSLSELTVKTASRTLLGQHPPFHVSIRVQCLVMSPLDSETTLQASPNKPCPSIA